MSAIENTLTACSLFTSLTGAEIQAVARQTRFSTRRFQRDAVVAFEDDPCSAIGIVVSGSIHIQRIFENGRQITIETFHTNDSFGEALVFADEGAYPATLVAKEDTEVLYIAREDIVQLCSRYPHFLDSFLRTLSNRILLLNSKIKSLSYQTVRRKVANYLLEERKHQKTDHLTLSATRAELADSLGIPRPSLSRELIAMKEAGWINFNRNTIQVHDPAALEKALA